MLFYRVGPYLPGADPSAPGGPLYLHRPQGRGRVDNDAFYAVWYLSVNEAGAVGEVFAQHPTWTNAMFNFGTRLPGAKYALFTFSLDDHCPILELDDPKALLDRGIRPSRVVSLNRAETQAWALNAWMETGPTGRRWSGIRWWSRHNSDWPVLGIWGVDPVHVRTVELDIDHPAVVDAANHLKRTRMP